MTQMRQFRNPRKWAFIRVFLLVGIGTGVVSFLFQKSEKAQAAQPTFLSLVWSASHSLSEQERVLRDWSITELAHHAMKTTAERDPITGSKTTWKGILLSKLVEEAIDKLPLEDRAQFDLVILKGHLGETAFIPRALITKYPFLLAVWTGGAEKSLGFERGPIYSIVPWTSRPKILNEDLPLENFFVPKIVKIELANYGIRYGSLFLKRRTDPSAIRGEKIFVQSCTGCHAVKKSSGFLDIAMEEKTKRYFMGHHPTLKGVVMLSEKSRKSITRYLEAYRAENGLSLSSLTSSSQTPKPN